MLVLTRRREQSIAIGDPFSRDGTIEVIILEVRGDQVRLGIKAPATTAVHRAEVYKQVQREQREQPAEGASQPAVIGEGDFNE